MEIYFVLDFYCQTVSGLKRDIKESGVSNIDPWEDMMEDANFIEEYLLSQIALESIEHYCFQDKTKYVLRFLCRSDEEIGPYIKSNKASLHAFVKNGWAPFSIGGIPFKVAQLTNKMSWLHLDKKVLVVCEQLNGRVYSFKK